VPDGAAAAALHGVPGQRGADISQTVAPSFWQGDQSVQPRSDGGSTAGWRSKSYPRLTGEFREVDAAFSRTVNMWPTLPGQGERRLLAAFGQRRPDRRGTPPPIRAEANQQSQPESAVPLEDGRELLSQRRQRHHRGPGGSQSGILPSNRQLFRVFQRWDVWSYDVQRDGQEFVVNSRGSDWTRPMVMVTNWPETLRRK
jgi:hypothetical protein